jgi:hypothetical protein
VKTFFSKGLLLVTFTIGANASILYVGNDIQTPVAVHDSDGTFLQFFGQNGATGTAINAAGHIWTVAPNFGSNNVVEYDAAENVINSFIATINGNWIEDMSHGAGNSIWVGTFEGNVFEIDDQTGAVLSSFAVPDSTFTGVAFDGVNLWLTGGLTSNNLFYYTTSGTLLNTIPLGAVCGGIGYDASDGTLYCGDFGVVRHYTTTGTLLGSFNTTSTAYHDGLEVGVGNVVIPEPGELVLMGIGLAGLIIRTRRRSI